MKKSETLENAMKNRYATQFIAYIQEHNIDGNACFENNFTLLSEVASYPNAVAKIEWLITEKKANVNAQSPNGLTALMTAAVGGFNTHVKKLLEHQADPDLKFQGNMTARELVVVAMKTASPEKMQQYEKVLHVLDVHQRKLSQCNNVANALVRFSQTKHPNSSADKENVKKAKID